MRMFNPPHPGEALKEFLSGISVTDAAKQLGITRVTLSRILNGKSSITAEMALRLSKALETSPDVWIGMQTQYDLWQAEHKSNVDWSLIKPLTPTSRNDAVQALV